MAVRRCGSPTGASSTCSICAPVCWPARHGCGADEYIVSFQVRAAGWLEECWQVTGPLKAYDSMTTLRRLDVSSLA